MMQINQLKKESDYGLVINWTFHKKNRWVCAQTHYLVEKIISEFSPIIISSQLMYEIFKDKVKYIISLEPGWGAPKIRFDRKRRHIIAIFLSDPHLKTNWLEKYMEKNNISYLFSYYYNPLLYHFPNIDKDKIIHVPWAIPDQFILDSSSVNNYCQNKIQIFGAMNGEAYDIRKWCRNFSFVETHQNSGCENKILSDGDYFKWLQKYDAIIAAGSLSKKYQLVTPKYFEIPAAGALLFAQYCDDLDILGFNDDNCIIFDKENFETSVRDYLIEPDNFMGIRINGNNLIRDRHKISDRIKLIKKVLSIG